MSRAYLRLLVVGLIAALAVALAARRPHRPPAAPAAPVVAAPLRVDTLVVRDGAIAPDPVVVPKGARVRLVVRNAGAAAVRIALAGYAERVSVAALAPGERWDVEFIADLPGEDFAFLVDGRPAGRFVVTGSHLVEGHR